MIWLYPSVTSTAALPGGAGRHDGVLAEGTVTSGATLHVRPIPTTNTSCPGGVANFAQALAKIRAGEAYVNVRTNDGVVRQHRAWAISRAARSAVRRAASSNFSY